MKLLIKSILLMTILSLMPPPGVVNAARISGDTRAPGAADQADPGTAAKSAAQGNADSVNEDETPGKKSSSRADRIAGKKNKKESAAKSGRKSPPPTLQLHPPWSSPPLIPTGDRDVHRDPGSRPHQHRRALARVPAHLPGRRRRRLPLSAQLLSGLAAGRAAAARPGAETPARTSSRRPTWSSSPP